MSKDEGAWPVPLRRERGASGDALRDYEARTRQSPDEAAAFTRVLDRCRRAPSRPRWLWLAGAAVPTVVALGLLLRSGRQAGPAPSRPLGRVAAAPVAGQSPTQVSAPTASPPVPLGKTAVALPVGDVDLVAGVRLKLQADAKATARLQDGTVDIVLGHGALSLRVSPRGVGRAVLVTAGVHLLTVVGTELEVDLVGARLRVAVGEGLVAVSRAGDHLATVAAGETWSSDAVPEPRHPAPRLARHEPRLGCERFTGEQGPQKVACLRDLASKGGPAGERAQHALGRYLRDDLADPTAALVAFEAQRARFPHGELKVDADRAIIDLLPRLGRHAEALVETQSFLDAQPDADDRAEIRLLRGDIFRAIFQDATSAEREYEEGVTAPGRTGDDSRFLHALCLEALGRVDEARLAYRDYLARPGPAHAREAERRMQRLVR